nr:probable E3 ubiquitin-protein ligase makorin-1 [Parasteatoda tepidariorum]
MAESAPLDMTKLVRPFDLSSSCQEGNRCNFRQTPRFRENIVCRFSLKGICMFGDNCWYSHPKAEDDVYYISQPCSEEQNTDHLQQQTGNMDIFPAERNFQNFNTSLNGEASLCRESDLHDWINVPEFVPKSSKYLAIASNSNDSVDSSEPQKLDMEFCPHFFDGVCPFDDCPCIHGELCELCQRYCLDPFDEKQRGLHIAVCRHERDTDIRRDLSCGICLDIVLEKDRVAERRFGILENCNHVFCLSCIIKWRNVRNSHEEDFIDPDVTRACPECRVPSRFYIPSKKWVHSEGEKEILIAEYKKSSSTKRCKYFKNGKGICPFGEECFHLHAMPVIPSAAAQTPRFSNRMFRNSRRW